MPDTDPLIASDRANATFNSEEPLHACLFSDRMAATPLVIQSVAEHASRPDLIHIWVVTPKESYEEFKRLAVPNTFKNGIHVHVMALEDITAELVNHKYKPVWTWKEFGSSLHNPEWLTKPMSTEPLRADVDPKHMHPMNHLRFYLPYMDVFKDAKRLVLLDDDVVLQGDLNDLVSLPFPRDKVIITNCRRWKHHNGTFAYEIPFKGDAANVLLGRVEHATRKQMAQHWKNLNTIASQINGHEVSLHNETYFNFGVSLLNLDEWKRLDLTGTYHKWMRANYKEHIFREDTLAYGLGIPFCTFYGHVLCHHPKNRFQVLDGPGWLSWDKMQLSGWDERSINNTFAMHYNGRNKPWYMKPAPGFRKLHPFLHNTYLRYANDLPYDLKKNVPAMRRPDDFPAAQTGGKRLLQEARNVVQPGYPERSPDNNHASVPVAQKHRQRRAGGKQKHHRAHAKPHHHRRQHHLHR